MSWKGDYPFAGRNGLGNMWRYLNRFLRQRGFTSPVNNIYELAGGPDYWDRFFVKPDPWGYSSEYEITKRGHTLSLIPAGECERGLEVACAEGHFTVLLAQSVGRLVASDISTVALERAVRRCRGKSNIAFE